MSTTRQTYVHATSTSTASVGEVAARLRTDALESASRATAAAVAALTPLLASGNFRRTAEPRVEVDRVADGEGVLRVAWDRDDVDHWPPRTSFATRPTSPWWRSAEEETGWPTLTFEVLVGPGEDGTRLAAVSHRAPGTDLTTNRIDRQLRDRVARAAVELFLTALVADLDGG